MLEPKAVRRVEVITGNGSAAAVLQRRSFAPGRGFGGGAAAWADAIATVAPTGGGADECQDERRLFVAGSCRDACGRRRSPETENLFSQCVDG